MFLKMMLQLTRPKTLLLDVDGVVFNNPAFLNRISNKIVDYVATELRVKRDAAEHINKLLYQNYGHTQLGLQKVYNNDKSLQHFAEEVYDDNLLKDLREVAHSDDQVFKNCIAMKIFMRKCQYNDVDFYLFSNAPSRWCRAIVESMGLENQISDDCIIASDHDVFGGRLKPHKNVYENMQKLVAHTRHDDCVEILFVDDTFQNLVPVIGNPMWRPIRFDTTGSQTLVKSSRVNSITHLSQLHNWI
jgi:FMN phosphatase YigB (HAD superfamily)